MSDLRRISDAVAAAGLALAVAAGGIPAAGPAVPQRVVSINLCTDQLALMLAAPGQLASVTAFAQDPRQSAMADAARALPANHARAEEVYLLRPDLVLASDFTSPASLAMLRRLGLRVEAFPAATSLADVDAAIGQMGRALGRQDAAATMQARFRADLAALRADIPARPPRSALYEPNGYSPGPQSLAGEITAAAGFSDIAAEAGLPYGGTLPLEQLVMLAPEAIISPGPAPGTSRGYELLQHPALRNLRARGIPMPRSDSDWGCAAPQVLDAAGRLAAARKAAGR
ncbi:ABC transporter substrate-binding protein [Paracoccus suum]|nr:ABC transporter substrate-binding protein [Paracoccus suum]